MIDVTIKTLYGKVSSFSVPDDITVKEFKEKVASSIEITAENQRLIYSGRVLQDDKKLNDYDVNGKTIHVVEKPPPSSLSQNTAGSSSSTTTTTTGTGEGRPHATHNIVLGPYRMPADNVGNILQEALSGVGALGNPRVSTQQVFQDAGIHPTMSTDQIVERRIDFVEFMISRARQTLDRIENGNSTNGGSRQTVDEQQTVDSANNNPSVSSTQTPSADSAVNPVNLDVEAIAIVTETIGAEIEMEIDDGSSEVTPENVSSSGESSNSARANAEAPTGTGAAPRSAATEAPVISTIDYANVLDEIFEINRRLQPHFERYQRMLRDNQRFDGQNGESSQEAQMFFDQVSSVLHNISHLYHSISEIMIDMNHAPPRRLSANYGVVPQLPQLGNSVFQRINSSFPAPPSSTTGRATTSSSTSTSSSSTSQNGNSSSFSTHVSGSGGATASIRVSATSTGTAPTPQGGNIIGAQFVPDMISNILRMVPPNAGAGGVIQIGPNAPTAPAGSAAPPPTLPRAMPHGFFNLPQPVQPGGPRTQAQPSVPRPQAQPGMPRPQTQPGVPRPQAVGIINVISQQSQVGPQQGQQGTQQQQQQQARSAHNEDQLEVGFDITVPCLSRFCTLRPQIPTSHNIGANQFSFQTPNVIGVRVQTSQTQGGRNQPAGGTAPRMQSVLNPFAALFGGNLNTPMPGAAPPRPQNPTTASGFVDQLRNVLAQGAQPTVSTQGSTSTTTTTTATPTTTTTGAATGQQPVTDDMFTQLVSGIGQYVGQANAGQEPLGNISDFLSSLGERYMAPQGESLLTDIFNVVASSINIMDLMQLFSGNSTSLQRTREPLQRYIKDTLMEGAAVSEDSIESCVNRLLADAGPYLEQFGTGLETVDDIDFEATASTFLENHLQGLITYIMNSREGDQEFHVGLYSRVRRLIHEAIILGENCLQGGFQAVTRLAHTRIGVIASDVNPLIRQWMSDVSTQQLAILRPNITVTVQDVQSYIIKGKHRERVMEAASCSASSEENEDFMSADEDNAEAEKKPENSGVKPKEKQNNSAKITAATNGSSQANESGAKPKHVARSQDGSIMPRVAPEGGSHPSKQTEGAPLHNEKGELMCVEYSNSAARQRPQMTPMAYHAVRCAGKPSDDNIDSNVRLGSEDWHSVVPEEWVSVIAKDIERQKKQEKQKPQSDAYLNGNPAKKRKVTRFNRTETEELAHPECSMQEALQFSANAVGAQPVRSPDRLSQDIAANTPLQEAFHQEVRNEVRKTLRDDKDLVPYKYKNTEKYFGNKK